MTPEEWNAEKLKAALQKFTEEELGRATVQWYLDNGYKDPVFLYRQGGWFYVRRNGERGLVGISDVVPVAEKLREIPDYLDTIESLAGE